MLFLLSYMFPVLFVKAIEPSSISCSVSPLTVTLGESVAVTGAIAPEVPGVEVTLTYTRPDATMFTRKTITSLHSTYADVYTPDKVSTWAVVASWSGNDRYAGATSPSVSFTTVELPSGTSIITCMTDFSSIIIGDSVNISGKIVPAHLASVTIEVSTDGGASWNLLTTVTSASDGSYQYMWAATSTGSYLLRARWLGDSSHSGATSTEVSVIVHSFYAPDFNISANPSSRKINAGETTTFTVTITSLYGFNSPVALGASGLPTDATGSFNPASVSGNGSSILTISTTGSTPQGTSTVAISGTGGGKARATTVSLEVTSPAAPARCLIATATYGSELSPEVQFLREFRDQNVMSTFAGRQFMTVFNAFYYSFSPAIAQAIIEYPAVKSMVRLALYPLLTILHLSAMIFSTLSPVPEFAILMSGVVASSLIGLVYGFPIALVLYLFFKTLFRSIFKFIRKEVFGPVWIFSLMALLVGEVLRLSDLTSLATVAIVLLTISNVILIVLKALENYLPRLGCKRYSFWVRLRNEAVNQSIN